MRVLVLSSLYRDPAARDKLRAIAGLGCEVIAGTPGGEAGTDQSIRLAPIPVKGTAAEPTTLRWHAPTIKRLLTELRPDLVQIEEEPDSALADTAADLCSQLAIPYVVFSWQSLPAQLRLWGRRRRTRVLRGAAGVIGGNTLAEELLRAEAPNALSTALPQGGITMPPPLPPAARTQLTFGFAGRLVPERGLAPLLESLSQTYGIWELVVAGAGPEQEALDRLVERLGLASRIRWLGGIRAETLLALWQAIDCLVVPSRATPDWVEHHSAALIDAMARGIAPIVTRSGALPELVAGAGLAVNDGAELTAALQRWVAEPARCRAMGAAARQRVLERYATPAIAAATVEFWKTLLEERHAVRHAS